jgi:hypothetical protein
VIRIVGEPAIHFMHDFQGSVTLTWAASIQSTKFESAL